MVVRMAGSYQVNYCPSHSTVLLVEDLHRSRFRTLPRFWFRDHGYCVLEATNGLEALHQARTHQGPIDLLTTEIDLSLMDGGELTAHVRKLCPQVKVMFVVPETTPIRAFPSSVAYIHKPFDTRTLLKKVQSHEQRRRTDARNRINSSIR